MYVCINITFKTVKNNKAFYLRNSKEYFIYFNCFIFFAFSVKRSQDRVITLDMKNIPLTMRLNGCMFHLGIIFVSKYMKLTVIKNHMTR